MHNSQKLLHHFRINCRVQKTYFLKNFDVRIRVHTLGRHFTLHGFCKSIESIQRVLNTWKYPLNAKMLFTLRLPNPNVTKLMIIEIYSCLIISLWHYILTKLTYWSVCTWISCRYYLLTHFTIGSIAVGVLLTSCFTGLDYTKHVNLLIISTLQNRGI